MNSVHQNAFFTCQKKAITLKLTFNRLKICFYAVMKVLKALIPVNSSGIQTAQGRPDKSKQM